MLQLKPSKKATYKHKAYCKRLSDSAPWCIRFEATVLGEKLKKTLGKILPPDLTLLPNCLEGIEFDEHWKFERFQWDSFLAAAERTADYKKVPHITHTPRVKLYARLAKIDAEEVTMWQMALAKKLARRLAMNIEAKTLARRVGSREFNTPLALEDLFW